MQFCIFSACRNQEADIVFALDSAIDLNRMDFWQQMIFLRQIFSIFNIGPTKTRIGVITYSDKLHTEWDLNAHNSAAAVRRAASKIQQSNARIQMADILQYIRASSYRNKLFRPGAARIAVIFTSTASSIEMTKKQALLAKISGIHIFVVGIGDGIDFQELNAMADETHGQMFLGKSYSKLLDMVFDVAFQACQSKTSAYIFPSFYYLMTLQRAS